MMYYYNDFIPFHFFGFGFLFMILFWGLIIYGLVTFFKKEHGPHENNGAMKILKERYAKGEITREEFELMKKDIK